MFKRRSMILVSMLMLTLVLPTVLPFFLAEQSGLVEASASPTDRAVAASVSSEEENIDSFDVNPKSGRWNVTNDNNTDDLVTDSILRMTTINNMTSDGITDPVGYEMNRGTTKTDGKIEYRMAASGGGNQTEYSRDVLGDKWDFEEGDLEDWSTTVGVTVDTVSDGILIIETTGGSANVRLDITGLVIPVDIYHRFKMRIKYSTTSDDTPFFRLKTLIADGSILGANTLSTEWTTFDLENIDTDSDWSPDITGLRLFFDENTDGTVDIGTIFYIEFIELIGNLDYATHIEGEIEDTWDWEDSNEYWYTEEGNVSDFNDGTTENWIAVDDTVISLENGWLVLEDDDGLAEIETDDAEAIDSTIYAWMTFEFITNVTIDTIRVRDPTQIVAEDVANKAAGTHLWSWDLDLDVDWAGVETGLKIDFFSVGLVPLEVKLNMTYLYDTELGDIEEFTGNKIKCVQPEGYLSFTATAGSGAGSKLRSKDPIIINTDNFNILIVKAKSITDSTAQFSVLAAVPTEKTVSTTQQFQNNSWHTFVIDLSLDSDWSDIATYISFRFDESDGVLEGDERIIIDYILLLGHWADSDSVIGLFDQDNLVPLLNVSTVFTSNNSHSVTSDKAYFTVELLDLDGEVAYSAISANYTDISDLWIQGKITFDILRSKLAVTIIFDNSTRIDKWTFPIDFTEVSGRIPALFSNEKAGHIFTSTFCQATSWQEMRIDFIKADFVDRKWVQTDNPTDPQWDQDYWYLCALDGPVVDTSNWTLNIPYLDTFSGDVTYWEEGGIDDGYFYNVLYAATSSTGDLVRIGYIEFGIQAQDFYLIIYDPTNSSTIIDFETETVANAENPRYTYAISLSDDRTILTTRIRLFWIGEDTTDPDYFDLVYNYVLPLSSLEFSIEHHFNFNYDEDKEIQIIIDNFGFIERDIFSDIAKAIIDPLWNFFSSIFIGIFRFFADIFKFVGDLIAVAVKALEPFLTAIQTAISQIEEWLNTIASTISDAIADIAADIWTAFGTAASGIMDDIITALTGLAADVADFVDSLIQFLIPLLLAIASDLAGLVVGILDALIAIGGDILSGIINFIAGIVFFFWEALGLPDVLAILDMMLATIFEVVSGIPKAIEDIVSIFAPIFIIILALYWFWLIFLGFASQDFDPFAGIAEVFGRLFTTIDISIAGFGPIPFPIAFFFIPLTYFLIVNPSGSMFALW